MSWLQCILRERLSPHVSLSLLSKEFASITIANSTKRIDIALDPSTFTEAGAVLSMGWWNAVAEGWTPSNISNKLAAPGLPALQNKLIQKINVGYRVNYDVLGLIYWMFSRLEEISVDAFDDHGRVSAFSSHAYRNGYLDRPIIDEWFIVLRQVLVRLWPGLDMAQHEFKVKLSHDVDIVSRYHFAPRLGGSKGL